MALINCPECGKEISDKALSCPNCGVPMCSNNSNPAQPIAPKSKKRWWLWLLVVAVVGVIAGAVAVALMNNVVETKETDVKVYKVGDYYNENGKQGVVFEVSVDGCHGKIISMDQTKVVWDSRVEFCVDEFINETTTNACDESDGKTNTDKLMARDDSEYFEAAKWCRVKGDDWYLPAIDELETICGNVSNINATLANNNGTTLSKGGEWDLYWSSTEDFELCACGVLMNNGNTIGTVKCNHGYVRAVSTF